MPISLPPLTRRRFLAGSLAAGAGVLAGGRLWAEDAAIDADRFALLSDTHIAGDRKFVVRETNLAENLERVAREVVALPTRPASVLVCGDCAYNAGTSEDYATLVELLAPMRQRGLPVHLALGNHDHRERFWAALPAATYQPPPVHEKHISVLRSPRANWFVLDSLDETNKTPGVLGPAQLTWLEKALTSYADKPALVMVHHNPDDRPMPGGLVETKALLDLLAAHQHAKVLFFGHSHNWDIKERDGLHLVNLPPVAYTFAKGKPSGWVDLKLSDAGATLDLRCLDDQHPQHAQHVELKWRA